MTKLTRRERRIIRYRRLRGWVLYDRGIRMNRMRQIRRTKRIANAEKMEVLAFIGGRRESMAFPAFLVPPTAETRIDFSLLRTETLYPKLRQTTQMLRECKRKEKRLRGYETTAKVLRCRFGDIADHILELL